MGDILLQKQNKQLRERLSLAETELQNKTRRIEKMQVELNDTQKQYEELLSRIIELQQNEEETKVKLMEFESMKQKNNQLISFIQQKDNVIQAKTQEINQLKSEIQSYNSKIAELKECINIQNKELSNFKVDLQNCQDQYKNKQQEFTNLQNQLTQKNEIVNQSDLKMKNLEQLNDFFKNQISSIQMINEKTQSEIRLKEESINKQQKELEDLNSRCEKISSLVKNATYILTGKKRELDSEAFFKILKKKLTKPKLCSISTQSDNIVQEYSDSCTFTDPDSFQLFQKPKLPRQRRNSISHSSKEKRKSKQYNISNEREYKMKDEAVKKIGQIKDQFQSDLTLERIIQMHNKLWQEENEHINSIRRKNQKVI